MEVASVVTRVLNGDAKALEELIGEFQNAAVGYAFSVTRDYGLAEDLAQEAFIQAIKSIPSLRNAGAFPSWFFTILRFTCIRHIRKNRIATAPLDLAYDIAGPEKNSPEDLIIEKDEAEKVLNAVNKFNEEDRAIFLLRHIHGCSYKQTAAALRINEARVTNRLFAMRKTLRRELSEYMDMPAYNNGDFKKRVINGVKKVGYAADGRYMLTQFCGCFSALLSALGKNDRADYAEICAVSGAAFRMVWKDGFDMGNVDVAFAFEDPFMPFRLAFRCAGLDGGFYGLDGSKYGVNYDSKCDALKNYDHAKKDIAASVDRGFPVLALGVIGPPECCIITGYEDGGDTLMGFNYFQDDYKNDPDISVDENGLFRRKNWFDGTAAYIILREADKNKIPSREEAAIETIKIAVKLARTEKTGERASGLNAYAAMAEQILNDGEYLSLRRGDGNLTFADKPEIADDVTNRFGAFMDAFLMICERKNAAAYLEGLAADFPYLNPEIKEAAEHYKSVQPGDPNELWKRLGLFDNMQERFRDPDVRSILAAQVLRCRLHERKAVECLERLLLKLSEDGVIG